MAVKFNKRQYETIAAVFAKEKPGANWDANKRVQHNLLLSSMTDALKLDNPEFKPDRFLEAAGGWCTV